jgi:uncharacterized protein with ACT and thioredoxin-like domain
MTKKKKTSSKKAIKKTTNKKVVKKKIVKKEEAPIVQEHLSERFYFDIESLVTDGNSLIKEIVFTYTGSLVIPKSLKSIYEKKSVTVHGSYIIKDADEGVVTKKDYKSLSKNEVKTFLIKYLRDDYITGMQDIIKKDLLPDTNLVVNLPWK